MDLSTIFDLCTLPEITDTALLHSLRQRLAAGETAARVGNVVLVLPTSHPPASFNDPVMVGVASQALHSLQATGEDQSIILFGAQGPGKTACASAVVRLLLRREAGGGRVVEGTRVLKQFTVAAGGCSQCLLATEIAYGEEWRVGGVRFVMCAMDTSRLLEMEVLARLNEGMGVWQQLLGLGMEHKSVEWIRDVMSAVKWLCGGGKGGEGVSGCAGALGMEERSIEELLAAERMQLAALVYEHTVQWLVHWLNSVLMPREDLNVLGTITILDPQGTPSRATPTGHASQLLSSYVQEVLYHIMHLRVFVWEQEQYTSEGVEWEMVEVQGNSPTLQAFQQPEGLLDCASGGEGLDKRLISCCHLSQHVSYITMPPHQITVAQYWGEQTYNLGSVQGLPSLRQLLVSSSCQQLRELPVSGTESLRENVSQIVDTITTSTPHFILTLTPSQSKELRFDSSLVLTQLQQLRVLDITLMYTCGYPVRMPFQEFLDSYGSILPGDQSAGPAHHCWLICQAAGLTEYHIGKTQVLLKSWHLGQVTAHLEAVRLSRALLHREMLTSELSFEEEEPSQEDQSTPTPPATAPSLHNGTSQYPAPNYAPPPPPLSPSPPPPHSPSPPPLPPPRNSVDPLVASQPHSSHPSPAVPSCMSQQFPSRSGSSAMKGQTTLRRKKESWKRPQANPPSSKPDAPNSSGNAHSNSTAHHMSLYWYHGKISREEAEMKLRAVKMDTFLVRESENRAGGLSLSLKHKGVVKHFRIDHRQGTQRFELYGAQRSFPELSQLIEYYSQYCITTEGEVLTTPCPREGGANAPPPLPPRRRNLSTIRRPKAPPPSLPLSSPERPAPQSPRRVPPSPTRRTKSTGSMLPGSVESSESSLRDLERELEIEQRILEAARRMADLPTGSKKERHRRRQSLQQAQGRIFGLRQQYHSLRERLRFIHDSMQNLEVGERRVSAPIISSQLDTPTPPPRSVS